MTFRTLKPLLVLAFIAGGALTTGEAANTVTVDPSTTFQTIVGWEASAGMGQVEEPGGCLQTAYQNYKSQVLDLAVTELGLNRVRLSLDSGFESPIDYFTQYITGPVNSTTYAAWKATWFTPVNDNTNPNFVDPTKFQWTRLDYNIDQVVNPLRQRLQAKGEKLYVNLNYNDFAQGHVKTFIHMKQPAEYAEYIAAAFQHIQQKYGWTPDALEILLEPQNAGDINTTITGADLGAATVAAGNRLAALGFHPDVIAPSDASMGNSITLYDSMVQTPGVSQYLKELSYHRYQNVSLANLQAIAFRGQRDHVRTAMLEWNQGNSIDTLIEDLTIGNNSAWQQYSIAYCANTTNPSVTGIYFQVNQSNPASPIVTTSYNARDYRQIFYYVRAGAVRLGAASGNTALLVPVAFRNANGTTVAVVRTLGAATFSVSGLPAGTYGVNYSVQQTYNVNLPDVVVTTGGSATVSIPAKGIITLYQRTGAPPPPPDTTPPQITRGPTATPSTVTGTTSAVSVRATDNVTPTSQLIYIWSGPAGASFSANTSNAAQDSVATFSKTGTFTLQVVVKDVANNGSAPKTVAVTVTPTLTVTITPAQKSVSIGGTIQFVASAIDQFGTGVTVPTWQWNVSSGGGAISSQGLYTAPQAPGVYTVTAVDPGSGKSASAQVTVTAVTPPQVSLVSPAPNSAFTAPATILLQATFARGTNPVSKIEFLSGATVLNTVTNPTASPVSYTRSNVGVGTYALYARATDSQGLVNSDGPITATVTTVVNGPPVLSGITASAPDADLTVPGIQVTEGTTETYQATVSDPNNNLASWQWLYTVNGGLRIPMANGTGAGLAQQTFSYAVGDAGKHYTWILRGTDQLGAFTESSLAQDVIGAPKSQPVGTSPSLVSIRVFPNPWRQDRHGTLGITFDGLTTNSVLRIFTVAGHKVAEFQTDGPQLTWDLMTTRGEAAGSGIYVFSVSNRLGQKAHGKFAIIR